MSLENFETEQNIIEEHKMSIEDLGVGDPKPRYEPEEVLITSLGTQEVTWEKEGKKGKGNKLVIGIEHSNGPLEISKIEVRRGDSLKQETLWVNLDQEGKIKHGSTVHHLLEFFKVEKIGELDGKRCETLLDDKGYLMLKCY